MFLRYKMNKTLKTIKALRLITDESVIASFNTDVLSALKQSNCIDIQYADNQIYYIKYKSEAMGYKLERSQLWANRFWSFVLGVISGVITTLLSTYLLKSLL